jgi:EmrB/QacA subfamily drug resistance transporter
MTTTISGRSTVRQHRATHADAAPSKWAIFGLVSVGTFMTTLDASIVNIALPSIARSFGSPVSGLVEWVVIAYLVVVAATLLTFGRLADLLGRERIWVAGLALFTAGSLLAGLAPTLMLMVGARAIQGLGAAMIFAPALALIVDAFPLAQRGQALGMNALIVSLGVTAGPTIGGLITESFDWQWIYFVNIPLGIIGLIVARRVLRFQRGNGTGRLDARGAALFGIALAGLSLALSFGSDWGWTSPALLATLAVGLAALGTAVLVERQQHDPLVDIPGLLTERLGLPLVSFLFSIIALFAVGFLMPLYFEELRGFGPLVAGLLLTPYSIGLAVASPVAGRLADRGRSLWLQPLGLGLAAAGLFLLSFIGTGTSPIEIGIWLAISGVGQGIFLAPNTREVMNALPARQSGTASGLIATTRVVAQSLSVAFAGAVFAGLGGAAAGATLVARGLTSTTAGATLDGTFVMAMHAALLVSGAMAAAGALIALGARRRSIRSGPAASPVPRLSRAAR